MIILLVCIALLSAAGLAAFSLACSEISELQEPIDPTTENETNPDE